MIAKSAIISAAALAGALLALWGFAEGIFGWKFRADLDHAETEPIKERVGTLEQYEEERQILFGDAYQQKRKEAEAAQQVLRLLREGKLRAVEE